MYINQEIGRLGEELATKYLEDFNYEIIEKNFRCRSGEIDIIAKDKEEYVFIEVKTRSYLCYGRPAEAVNRIKKTHIYKATNYYLYKNHLTNAFVRFDVIEVYLNKEKYKIEHLKNVEICD